MTVMPAACHLPIISSSIAMRWARLKAPSKLEPNGLPSPTEACCAPAAFAAAMVASIAAICWAWLRL